MNDIKSEIIYMQEILSLIFNYFNVFTYTLYSYVNFDQNAERVVTSNVCVCL